MNASFPVPLLLFLVIVTVGLASVVQGHKTRRYIDVLNRKAAAAAKTKKVSTTQTTSSSVDRRAAKRKTNASRRLLHKTTTQPPVQPPVQAQVQATSPRNSPKLLQDIKSYDAKFLASWNAFRHDLWPNHLTLPDFDNFLVVQKDERPYRLSPLIAHWTSVDCNLLDLKLKMIGSIRDTGMNRVYKMRDRRTSKLYAYKVIKNPDHFYSELSFFQFLEPDHPYFARAVCNRRDDQHKATILFEFVDGSDSLEYARKATLPDLKRISAQLFLAIEHMHYLGIGHSDLKPGNVMIDQDGNVKLIDFGFAIHFPFGKRSRGTHFSMAPELHDKVPGELHENVDWWAYGSTLAMWFGAYHDYQKLKASGNSRRSKDSRSRYPFVPFDWNKTRFQVGTVPKEFPEDLRTFLYYFFVIDPELRKFNTPRLLNFIRQLPFFREINWDSLYRGVLNV